VPFVTDGITMGEDVKGRDAAVRWFASYFARYDVASHDAVAAAADDATRSSFSFYVDQVLLTMWLMCIVLSWKTFDAREHVCTATSPCQVNCDGGARLSPLTLELSMQCRA
jgi:hypothetical protein